jgi:inhibitor of the pro-sigma K processing machinery
MDIVSFLIGIVVLIVVLKILSLPFKIIIKFVVNSIIGGIILAICAYFGILINVYWWTVLLTGLFGVPGFVIATIITILI